MDGGITSQGKAHATTDALAIADHKRKAKKRGCHSKWAKRPSFAMVRKWVNWQHGYPTRVAVYSTRTFVMP